MLSPPGLPTAITRRGTLALALGSTLLLTTGCDLDDLVDDSAPGVGDPGPVDPDEARLDNVRAAVAARLAAVVATRLSHPRLGVVLAPLEAMHHDHLAALEQPSGSPSSSPTAPGVVPPSAARASRVLFAAEATHQQTLASTASTARSGALARLLGSMSAGVASHLAALPSAAQPATAPVATPAAGAPTTTTDVDALQVTLAGEHAAVYVYGVLGARVSQSSAPTVLAALSASYVAHRDLRDQLIGSIAAAGAQPVAAATAYRPPVGPGTALDTADGAAATAALLESACAAVYAATVGSAPGAVRTQAIGWLQTSAVRGLAFRGAPETFPGGRE